MLTVTIILRKKTDEAFESHFRLCLNICYSVFCPTFDKRDRYSKHIKLNCFCFEK